MKKKIITCANTREAILETAQKISPVGFGSVGRIVLLQG